jgi:hypothetical protein
MLPSGGARATRVALRLFRPTFCALLYVVVASLNVNLFLSRWGYRADTNPFAFHKLLDHTADRPYVFRVLTPVLINAIAARVPARAVEAIRRADEGREDPGMPTRSARVRFHWGEESTAAHYVAYGIIFGALLGTLYVMRRLAREVPGASGLFVDVAPAVAVIFLPLSFGRGGYIYDFPELLFCSLCLLALLERRWTLYYATFALACLNKESNLLLGIYFLAIWARRLPRRNLLGHLGLHAAIGFSILAWQRIAFADNPGHGAEFHLQHNLRFWLSPLPWVAFWDIYSPLLPAPRPFNLLVLFLVGMLVFYRWREKPAELRWSFLLMLAALAPLLLAFGFHDEVRNLSIAFPVFFLLACHGILLLDRARRQPGAEEAVEAVPGPRDAA